MIDYFSIIQRYFEPGSLAYQIYVPHACLVTARALGAAKRLALSPEQLCFIEEAAMLHDVGIVKVDAPGIGCHGDLPYLCHGVEGRKILEAEGLPAHALAAERHTGVGISAAEIVERNLPLPHRDLLATNVEEEIISWSDLFYGKSKVWQERPAAKIRKRLMRFDDGEDKTRVFDDWMNRFS